MTTQWERPTKALQMGNTLEKFTYDDTTPCIGREFLNVNIVDDIMKSESPDDHIRDLAITSEFCLCFSSRVT